MMDGGLDDLDNEFPNSQPSNFQLPPDILRNLTPIRKKNRVRPCTTRRNAFIENRRMCLEERSRIISERVRELKQRRDLFSKRLAKNLTNNLAVAKERRYKLLEARRERARKHFLQHESQPVGICGSRSVEAPNKIPVSPEYDPESLAVIRKAFKRTLLVKHSTLVKESNFFEMLPGMSYRQTLTLMKHDSKLVVSMVSLLRLFDLPDVMPKRLYRSFLYSFIMVADYMNSVATHSHGGFNSNGSDKKRNNLTNSLALLSYKLALLVINDFKSLVYSSIDDQVNPWCEQKLKLSKSWKYYHFFFLLYKSIHYENCISILDDALDIVENQLEILQNDDTSILKHRDFYLSNMKLLNHISSKVDLFKYDWDYFGISQDYFLREVIMILENLDRPQEILIRIDVNTLQNILKPSKNSSYQNIKYNEYTFRIPPQISILHWRKYWVEVYKDFKKGQHQNIVPSVVKAGLIQVSNNSNDFKLDIHSISQKINEVNLHNKYDNLRNNMATRFIFGEIVTVMVDNSSLYLEYVNKMEYRDIDRNSHETTTKWNFFKKNAENLKKESAKFDYKAWRSTVSLFLEMIRTGSSINRTVVKNFENIVRELSLQRGENNLVVSFIDALEEFEVLIMNLWLQKCNLRSSENLKVFENVCQFASENKFRIELGTNSPQLRFPRFYQFLIDNDDKFLSHFNNYGSMINASFAHPDLHSNEFDHKAYNYFKVIYAKFVLQSPLEFSCCNELLGRYGSINEFTDLFKGDIEALLNNIQILIKSSTLFHLTISFYSTQFLENSGISYLSLISKSKLSQAVKTHFVEKESVTVLELENIVRGGFSRQDVTLHIDSLLTYYRKQKTREQNSTTNEKQISQLFSSKLATFLALPSESDILRNLLSGNFNTFQELALQILSDFRFFTVVNYDLYSPLLNWIYRDIGEP